MSTFLDPGIPDCVDAYYRALGFSAVADRSACFLLSRSAAMLGGFDRQEDTGRRHGVEMHRIQAHILYGFYSHLNKVRFNTSQHINDL